MGVAVVTGGSAEENSAVADGVERRVPFLKETKHSLENAFLLRTKVGPQFEREGRSRWSTTVLAAKTAESQIESFHCENELRSCNIYSDPHLGAHFTFSYALAFSGYAGFEADYNLAQLQQESGL